MHRPAVPHEWRDGAADGTGSSSSNCEMFATLRLVFRRWVPDSSYVIRDYFVG